MERVLDRTQYDEGLRQFMLNMYNHTAAGLAVSGLVAYLTYASGALFALGGLIYLFIFAPLGMILWYSFAGQNWSYTIFWFTSTFHNTSNLFKLTTHFINHIHCSFTN